MKTYAWYSLQQEIVSEGTAVYARPDGSMVHVTEVRDVPDGENPVPSGLWDDYQFLGEVVRCVKHNPSLDYFDEIYDDDGNLRAFIDGTLCDIENDDSVEECAPIAFDADTGEGMILH